MRFFSLRIARLKIYYLYIEYFYEKLFFDEIHQHFKDATHIGNIRTNNQMKVGMNFLQCFEAL